MKNILEVQKISESKASDLCLAANGRLYTYDNLPAGETYTGQFIYFTKKGIIHENNWYLFNLSNEWNLLKCHDKAEAERCNNHPIISPNCREIVATNDYGLGPNIAKIPIDFIEVFATYYNNNETITEVEVEYEDRGTVKFWTEYYKQNEAGIDNPNDFKYNILKLNPDGTVKVKIKETKCQTK